MSFDIKLMRNFSDNNYLSKDITTISTITGNLKQATSIIDPVITCSGSLPVDCNYMYIPRFNRYYYINDIRSINDNLFEISGHVDVLQSYDNYLRSCEGIVARNAEEWNLYIDDGSFKIYSNPQLALKNFPSGFSGFSYVMAVAGG